MKFVLRSFILEKNCVDLKNTLVCVPAFCCQKELRRGLRFLDWKGQGAICFREMSWWVGSWEGRQKRFGNDFITKKFVNKTGSVLVFLVPLVIRSPAPLGFLIFRVLICSLYFVVVAIAYAVFLLKWCSFFFFLFFLSTCSSGCFLMWHRANCFIQAHFMLFFAFMYIFFALTHL